MLTEESRRARFLVVENVHKWVGVFAQRSCVDDHFIKLLHFLKELHRTRSNEDVNFEAFAVYLNWQHNALFRWWFETRVHKCFIKIKNKWFLSFTSWALWAKHTSVQSFLDIKEWSFRRRRTNDSSSWNLWHCLSLRYLSDQVAQFLRSLVCLIRWLWSIVIWIIVSGRSLSLEVMWWRISALN